MKSKKKTYRIVDKKGTIGNINLSPKDAKMLQKAYKMVKMNIRIK